MQHFAILYPDRRELARAVERLLESGYPIGGAEDHGATLSVYLSDPDGNGIELYYDRPREEWAPQGRAVRSPRPVGGAGPHLLIPIHPSAWQVNSRKSGQHRSSTHGLNLLVTSDGGLVRIPPRDRVALQHAHLRNGVRLIARNRSGRRDETGAPMAVVPEG